MMGLVRIMSTAPTTRARTMAPPVTASWPRSDRLRSRSMVLMGFSSGLIGLWLRSRLAPRSGPRSPSAGRPPPCWRCDRPRPPRSAAVHDRDAVGELQDLVQLRGDEQDGRARIALGDDLLVDELDAAHVQAARRLVEHEQLAGRGRTRGPR